MIIINYCENDATFDRQTNFFKSRADNILKDNILYKAEVVVDQSKKIEFILKEMLLMRFGVED